MTIGFKKAVFGTAVTVIAIGLVFPAAFWLIAVKLDKAFGWSPFVGKPGSQILSAASILAGAFWASWAYSYLFFVGRGLPLEAFGRALHPTRVLVTTGPYAYTRNPMAVGVLFLFLGVAFLTGSASGLILIGAAALVIWVYVTLFEEKALEKRFGAEYHDYRANVPILIPRISAYSHPQTAGGQKSG